MSTETEPVVMRLASVLDEILRGFQEKGHPGYEARRSRWVEVDRVDKWRAVLNDATRELTRLAPEPSEPPPGEPDDGTVLTWVSDNDEVWITRRADDCAVDENNWLVGAEGDLRDWPWLLAHGAADATRLFSRDELIPDPDDPGAINAMLEDGFADGLLALSGTTRSMVHADFVLACRVLRARSEARQTEGVSGAD